MRNIACMLTVCLIVSLATGVSSAQNGTVALYSDEGGTDCNINDNGATCPIQVYVIYKGPIRTTASEFWLHQPDGAALIYLGETVGMFNGITTGRADTGIAVAHYGCQTAPLHILTVTYQGVGASAACSQLQIWPDPRSPHRDGANIALVDCQFAITFAEPGHLTINPDDDCGCTPSAGEVSPTYATSWGQVKALYAQ